MTKLLPAFFAALLLAVAACGLSAKGGRVELVPATHVCMIQNSFMHAAQTPVAIEGRTYHVCCEGCKNTIHKHPSQRTAKDPLSGAEIDKSAAVLGRDKSGKIHYFENEANLKAYRLPEL